MSVRLSIIVPFYGVEQYIEACIRSLYKQDIPYNEYEVICVDDCSPDGSRKIVESLQKEFPTLQLLVLPQNRKLGGARNAGLELAKGKYVWFVDSDDFVETNCLGKLINVAEQHDLDMLHFDFYLYDGHASINRGTEPYDDERVVEGFRFFEDESKEKWADRCASVWRRFHKRDFLIKNNLYFVENMMYEDTDLSIRMFAIAKRVMHCKVAAYYYRKNPESITHIKVNAMKMRYKIMQLHRTICSYVEAPTEYFKMMVYRYIQSELGVLRYEIKEMPMHEKIDYYHIMRRTRIITLKQFCNWRTWLAVRYGITSFVPPKKT